MWSPIPLLVGCALGGGVVLTLRGLPVRARAAIGLLVAGVVGVVGPVLTRQARERTEAPVIANLYLVALKQEAFREALIRDEDRDGRGEYGSLRDLYKTRPPLIHDAVGVAGEEFGYRYTLVLSSRADDNELQFFAYAVPIRYGVTGRRIMYVDESQVVRIADVGPGALPTRAQGAAWEPAPLPATF